MLLMIEKPRPTPAERGFRTLSRAFRAMPAILDWIVMGPFRAAEARHTLDTLAAMSDHELRDIGLDRGDLRDATALPAGRDLGLFLDGRRGWRRARR
ncbi:DUF1127 domain-containing protein [Lichenibacterium minor]|jgi:uncharacterized protein YjiS (DUF1127 family)|nr:DUF1127 domain-containing protein [Lichenibacterium minor]